MYRRSLTLSDTDVGSRAVGKNCELGGITQAGSYC
jgi:hypothetical protein